MTNITLGGAQAWQLGTRTRKGVLVVHIVSAGAWIGIDIVMAVFVFTALFAADDNTRPAPATTDAAVTDHHPEPPLQYWTPVPLRQRKLDDH